MRNSAIFAFLTVFSVATLLGQTLPASPGSPAAPLATLIVTPVDRPVDGNAGVTTFSVSKSGAGQMNYSAVSNAAWATITSGATGLNAGTITVSYEANSTGLQRVASITVTAPGSTGSPQTVTITQAPEQTVLTVAPSDQPVSFPAGTATFTVANAGTGTMAWTAISSDSWATISGGTSGTDSGTITVDYTANTSTSPRVATITVTAAGAAGSPMLVTISQSGTQPILAVSPADSVVGSAAGTAAFSVTNTGTGTMEWSASSSEVWAAISSGASGTDAGIITVDYTANTTNTQRVATLTITAAGATGSPATVTLTQTAGQPVLSITPADSAVTSTAGTATFIVTNSGTGTMAWTAASADGWATITSGNSGSDSGTITLTYAANPTNSLRVATITVTADGATGSPLSVTLTQAAGQPILSVTPADSAVPAISGSATFSVANAGTGTMSWTAVSSETWATISAGSAGTDDGTITVDYAANNTNLQRVGTLTITSPEATGSPIAVTLTQAGGLAVLSVGPTDTAVAATAGSAEFFVSNTGAGTISWIAVSDSSWATITDGSAGTDSGWVRVGYTANSTNAPRIATITITAPGASGSPKQVSITQAAGEPVLSVTPADSSVNPGAGTATFYVTNAGTGSMDWTATADSSWATIVSGSAGTNDGTITVAYSSNPMNAQRVATFTVTASGVSKGPLSVSITQAAGQPVLAVTPSDSALGAAAGTATFAVSNIGTGTLAWTASSDSAWATITGGSSGTNAGIITVSYAANTGAAQRSATITVTETGGSSKKVTITQAPGMVSDVEILAGVPDRFVLAQNYPNPFNPTTTIRFGLPVAGQVKLEIFNILGQKVASLAEGMMDAGFHTVSFDGSSLSSGIYLYRIQAENFVAVKRLVLQK